MSSLEIRRNITLCRRTTDRIEILRLLAEYRSLSTGQISTLLQMKVGCKSLRRVQSDLRALKQAGMVQSFPISPEAGSISQLGWILLKPGANWAGLDFRYGNHFRRIPGPEQIEFTDMKLDLERSVTSSAGWHLIKPQKYNRVLPLPSRTPQYYRLAEALTWHEFYASGRWPVGGVKGSHTLGVPLTANDYLAYSRPRVAPPIINNPPGNGAGYLQSPNSNEPLSLVTQPAYSEHSVVFILCPPGASEKFWQARVRQYQQIAGRLLVVGVFESEEKAINHKALLKNSDLRVTTLSRIKTVLEAVWMPQ